MAGENVQFEESQDKNCVKNLKRWNNNRRFFKKGNFLYFSDVWQGATADPSIVFERKESTPPPPPPHLQKIYYFWGLAGLYTHLYWAPLPSPLLVSDSNTARQTGWQEAIGWQGPDRRQAVTTALQQGWGSANSSPPPLHLQRISCF